MAFIFNSYYRITVQSKPPFVVQIINQPSSIHLIRVRDIETGAEKFLMDYFVDATIEIEQIPEPQEKSISA